MGAGGQCRLHRRAFGSGNRALHNVIGSKATVTAMDEVIKASQAVRELVDNRWIHLFALDDGGRVTRRYDIGGAWVGWADTKRATVD